MPRPFKFVSLSWPPSAGQWKGLSDTLEDLYGRLTQGLDSTVTLSGDVSGSGTDAITTTLASVNSNVGTFGDATDVPAITVDAKGRITAVTSTPITSNVALSYHGKIAAAYGDGNPNTMLGMLNSLYGTVANPSPSQITTTVARISYFILPFALTVNKIRYWSLANVTGAYSVAIYRFSDLARLTAQIDFDTPGINQWGAAGSNLALSLSANTMYFIACSVRSAASGTAGLAGFTTASTTNRPQASVLPSAGAGNLAAGNNYVGGGQLGQFAVTAGALPTPAATLAVQGSWAGGMPGFFLDASNA